MRVPTVRSAENRGYTESGQQLAATSSWDASCLSSSTQGSCHPGRPSASCRNGRVWIHINMKACLLVRTPLQRNTQTCASKACSSASGARRCKDRSRLGICDQAARAPGTRTLILDRPPGDRISRPQRPTRASVSSSWQMGASPSPVAFASPVCGRVPTDGCSVCTARTSRPCGSCGQRIVDRRRTTGRPA